MDKDYFNNVKVLFLDLDGTLINSEQAFYNSYKEILKENYNITITKEEYKKYELENNAKLLTYLREKYENIKEVSDSEVYSKLYERYLDNFKNVIEDSLVAETFNLIKKLKEKGFSISIISTSRRMYIDILLERYKLHDIFELIIAREDIDVNLLKPNPLAYQIALKKLNVDTIDVLSIEDSKRGVDASVNAGLKTIKVSNYTEIKYQDDRVLEMESANKVFKLLLNQRK